MLIDPEDKTIPCLICEKSLNIALYDESSVKNIEHCPIADGVECRTYGNYGSHVHDMSGTLFFVLCDICLVKNSGKMMHKASKDTPISGLQNGRKYFESWKAAIDKTTEEPQLDEYFA